MSLRLEPAQVFVAGRRGRARRTPLAVGEPVGSSSRAGLVSFLRFVQRAGVARVLEERARLPGQERHTGLTAPQQSLLRRFGSRSGSG